VGREKARKIKEEKESEECGVIEIRNEIWLSNVNGGGD